MNLVSRGLGNGNIVVRGLGGSVGTQTYQKVWADHVDSRPLLFPPTVLLPEYDVGLPLIDASPTFYDHQVLTTVSVTLPLLSTPATFHTPTLTTVSPVTVPLLDVAASLHAPTMYAGTAFLQIPVIADVATTFLPAVNTGVLLDLVPMTLGIVQATDLGLGVAQSLANMLGIAPMSTHVLEIETPAEDLVTVDTVVEFTVGIGAAVSLKVGVAQDFDANVGIDETFSRNLTQTIDKTPAAEESAADATVLLPHVVATTAIYEPEATITEIIEVFVSMQIDKYSDVELIAAPGAGQRIRVIGLTVSSEADHADWQFLNEAKDSILELYTLANTPHTLYYGGGGVLECAENEALYLDCDTDSLGTIWAHLSYLVEAV